jgi:hypothetical protein
MLAQLMQGRGQVVALDRSHAKVDDIRALAEELGCVHCVQAYKMDATKAVAKQRTGSGNAQQEQHGANDCQQQHQQLNLQDDVQQQQQCEAADNQQQRQQEQQEQQPPFNTAGLSAKAQARLQRRIAAMAARGQAPPAAEFRCSECGCIYVVLMLAVSMVLSCSRHALQMSSQCAAADQ